MESLSIFLIGYLEYRLKKMVVYLSWSVMRDFRKQNMLRNPKVTHSGRVMKTYNQSLLPTAYVAGAPSAAAEFKRYVSE